MSADGSTVHRRKMVWSMSCPAADLPGWIRFDPAICDRSGGAFARFYPDDLADLIKAHECINLRNAA